MSGDGWKHMPADQPRICSGCGQRVKLGKESIWFEVSQRRTWHFDCRRRRWKRWGALPLGEARP